MKLKTLGMLALTTLLGAAVAQTGFAQGTARGLEGPRFETRGNPGPGMRGPGAGREIARVASPVRFIELRDTDADGQVSEMEFVDEHLVRIDDQFERRDTDGDGLISVDEHEAPRGLRGGPQRLPRRDRPERPELDRAEVIACVRETIADYEPELDRPLDDIFDAVDTDGDGMLSLTEVSTFLEARAHALFARIDDNGDGFITESEVAAHFEEQLNLRRVIKACIDELTAAG